MSALGLGVNRRCRVFIKPVRRWQRRCSQDVVYITRGGRYELSRGRAKRPHVGIKTPLGQLTDTTLRPM